MTSAAVLPFLVTSLAIELTPGPNMAYLSLLSAQKGRLAGLAGSAGAALGLLLIGLLAALGFSAIVAAYPIVYELLRWSGVAFLLWLAYDTLSDTSRPAPQVDPDTILRESFLRGLITNLLNPKAFLFYVAVLPSFIDSVSAYRAQSLTLTLIYVTVATLVHVIVVLASGQMTQLLQNPRRRKMAGRAFAALLVIVAIWVALNTAR